MTTRRETPDLLTRDKLLAVLGRFALSIPERRANNLLGRLEFALIAVLLTGEVRVNPGEGAA
ncbi:MAG: hypothetical protein U0183_25285 [Polyangiaceae bacterium]